MKKILLILTLLLSCVWGEESSNSQWKSYFGVEAGVGNMTFFPAFIVSINLSMFKFNSSAFDWAYGGGIVRGWQKYTGEKVGMRNSFGFRVFVDPNYSS